MPRRGQRASSSSRGDVTGICRRKAAEPRAHDAAAISPMEITDRDRHASRVRGFKIVSDNVPTVAELIGREAGLADQNAARPRARKESATPIPRSTAGARDHGAGEGGLKPRTPRLVKTGG